MKPAVYGPQSTVGGLRSLVYSLRSTAHSPQSAFTLVELMVVVAIISVLLMLLIPNIRTMREKAWSANCQNNLRQYGVAMNQYMRAGSVGYGGGATSTYAILTDEDRYKLGGIRATSTSAESDTVGPPIFYNIVEYLPHGVTLKSLSDGQASVRVCPVVIQQIKKYGNFFDPDSSNFKGTRSYTDFEGEWARADFDAGSNSMSGWFSTYTINPNQSGQVKAGIPANVVAYIDWNARDGWWATLSYSNYFAFTGQNSAGQPVVEDVTPKWTNAWWITEVGFHHLGASNAYGANYVAMDGHVGWVSSNAISANLFQ